MRVITGSARGRRLIAPPGQEVRPTSAMVKEAIFSIIQFEVEGARVLDLFAGSGQMGIEALSRGARSCVLVDSAQSSLAAIKRNLEAAGLTKSAKVIGADGVGFCQGYAGEPFDIAFLDPPYAAGLLERTLSALSPWIREGGIVFWEADRQEAFPRQIEALHCKKVYRYGKTAVARYHKPQDDNEGV